MHCSDSEAMRNYLRLRAARLPYGYLREEADVVEALRVHGVDSLAALLAMDPVRIDALIQGEPVSLAA